MLHGILLFVCFLSSSLTINDNYWTDSPQLRRQLVAEAKLLIGSPYKYAGTTPKGFDCSGFTRYVYNKAVNMKLSRSSSQQSQAGKKVKLSKAIPGDLIFFKKNGKIFHVAMIIENRNDKLMVIHSTSSKGVILEDLNKSHYWKSKKSLVRRLF